MALCTEQGIPLFHAQGTILRGWAVAEQGYQSGKPAQVEAGLAQIHQGMAAWRATEAELWWPYYLAVLAEVYGHIGRVEEGLRALTEALTLVHTTGERYWEAEVHRLQGELLLQRAVPDAPQAEACFQQALAVARDQQAKSLELRAAMSLSRLWQRQDKREEAGELLAAVYGWFTEGFDTADLQEAKALLEGLGGTRPDL